VGDLHWLSGQRTIQRVGQAVGKVGADDQRALAKLRGAGGGCGGERRFANAPFAEIENEAHVQKLLSLCRDGSLDLERARWILGQLRGMNAAANPYSTVPAFRQDTPAPGRKPLT